MTEGQLKHIIHPLTRVYKKEQPSVPSTFPLPEYKRNRCTFLCIILEHKRNALVHYSIDLWNPGTNLNYFIDATMEASKESNITDLVVDVAG